MVMPKARFCLDCGGKLPYKILLFCDRCISKRLKAANATTVRVSEEYL